MTAPPSGADLARRAVDALRTVLDPEVGINVVDLGLVYGVEAEGSRVEVRLTMTTPSCPLGEHLVGAAEACLRALDGVTEVEVHLVWDPPWGPERMSGAARAELGWGER